MKRAAVVLAAFIIFGMLLSACKGTDKDAGSGGNNGNAGNSTGSKNQGITTNKVNFEEITDTDKLGQDVPKALETLKKNRSFSYFKTDGSFIVAIFAGQKNTGGYGIKVTSVEDIEGTTKITVQETEPKEGDIVTQAITYPSTVIKLKGIAENFVVVNQKGERFQLILYNNPDSGEDKPVSEELPNAIQQANGTYVGEIDGNSIEIISNGKPEAYRFKESLRPVLDSLEKDDKLLFSYYKNEYEQLILTKLEKVK